MHVISVVCKSSLSILTCAWQYCHLRIYCKALLLSELSLLGYLEVLYHDYISIKKGKNYLIQTITFIYCRSNSYGEN